MMMPIWAASAPTPMASNSRSIRADNWSTPLLKVAENCRAAGDGLDLLLDPSPHAPFRGVRVSRHRTMLPFVRPILSRPGCTHRAHRRSMDSRRWIGSAPQPVPPVSPGALPWCPRQPSPDHAPFGPAHPVTARLYSPRPPPSHGPPAAPAAPAQPARQPALDQGVHENIGGECAAHKQGNQPKYIHGIISTSPSRPADAHHVHRAVRLYTVQYPEVLHPSPQEIRRPLRGQELPSRRVPLQFLQPLHDEPLLARSPGDDELVGRARDVHSGQWPVASRQWGRGLITDHWLPATVHTPAQALSSGPPGSRTRPFRWRSAPPPPCGWTGG